MHSQVGLSSMIDGQSNFPRPIRDCLSSDGILSIGKSVPLLVLRQKVRAPPTPTWVQACFTRRQNWRQKTNPLEIPLSLSPAS
jgi:hypothetical protein